MNERPSHYRLVIVLLLFAASVINYVDRAALGVAAPFLQMDLALSAADLGLAFSVFFFGYAAFSFIGGQLSDRYGPHRVFSWAAGTWSLFCMLTGAVSGFRQLLIVRGLFGIAEGPMSSVTNRMITNWFPRNEVSRAIGFAFSGQMLGGAVAAPVVGLLSVAHGWRTAFFITGSVGLIWVLAWRYIATDRPLENRHVNVAEVRHIVFDPNLDRGASIRHESLPLRAYLWRPSTLSLGLGLFAINYIVFILLSWLPSYLVNAHHLDMKQVSWAAAVPWAGGFVGFVSGGALSDFIYSRLPNRLLARKLTAVVPQGLAAITLFGVSLSPSAVEAVTLISITLMMLMCSVQSQWATIHELVPQAHVGGVGGFIHLLSNISGIIGPSVTGLAIQYFGGYDTTFVAAGTLSLAGALAVALFVKETPSRALQSDSTRENVS